MITTTFFIVKWRMLMGSDAPKMFYVSDPFGDIEAAKKYADWRVNDGECLADVYEVQKQERCVYTPLV